jgi:hypothetical protein
MSTCGLKIKQRHKKYYVKMQEVKEWYGLSDNTNIIY